MTAVLIAVAALLALAAVFGAVLGFASEKFKVEGDPIVEQIDSLLPQTQCGQCGHPGCRPYAEAIAEGEEHNRCPPGGQDTVVALSELLGREELTLDNEGAEDANVAKVAYIREDECIGCTKCIQACPVDAIELTPRYEVVGLTRNEMVFDKAKLLEVYDQTKDEKPM